MGCRGESPDPENERVSLKRSRKKGKQKHEHRPPLSGCSCFHVSFFFCPRISFHFILFHFISFHLFFSSRLSGCPIHARAEEAEAAAVRSHIWMVSSKSFHMGESSAGTRA